MVPYLSDSILVVRRKGSFSGPLQFTDQLQRVLSEHARLLHVVTPDYSPDMYGWRYTWTMDNAWAVVATRARVRS